MASIAKRKNGTREIQWVEPDGRRRSLYLGKTPAKQSQTILAHVESLIHAQAIGTAPPQATSGWLGSLGDRFYSKLVKAGLVVPRDSKSAKTLGELCRWYCEDRGRTRQGRTVEIWQQGMRSLIDYFGEDQPIAGITEGDAESWREWMLIVPATNRRSPLGINTVRKRCSMARQFFKTAVRKRWLPVNPFDVLEGITVRANRSRDHFLTREDTAKLIDAAPDSQWRVILALSRYGGLRCPSEHVALRWEDVLWDQNKIRVTSRKTARHEGKGERIIPLFPELKEHLAEAFELAEPGTEHVVTRYRDDRQNLRTTFLKIIRRAGLEPWPKLMHNMRASRQTELASRFPAHVVCEWIGNSEAVAKEHYLRVTDGDFAEAISRPSQDTVKNTVIRSDQGESLCFSSVQEKAKNADTAVFSRDLHGVQRAWRDSNLGDFVNENAGFSESADGNTVESTVIRDQLASLRAGWPGVPDDVLLDALEILNGAAPAPAAD